MLSLTRYDSSQPPEAILILSSELEADRLDQPLGRVVPLVTQSVVLMCLSGVQQLILP